MQGDTKRERGKGWVGAGWRAPQDDVRGRVLTFRTQAVRVVPKEGEVAAPMDKQQPAWNVLPDVDPRPLVTVDGEPVEGTEEETQGDFVWPELPPFDADTEREQAEPQPYDRLHVSDEIDPHEARRRWDRLRFGLE
jgi:hypothetical protein